MDSPGDSHSSPASRRLYASGRKDSLACAQRAFPKTPTKEKGTTNKQENFSDDEQPDTVRRRRGYRPLSVLTKSVLYPFDSDALRAMDALTGNEADSIEQETKSGSRDEVCDQRSSVSTSIDRSNKSLQAESIDCDEGTPASRLYHHQVRHPSTKSIITVESTESSEISLHEFLKTSSPAAPVLKADYSSLIHLPAPDPSEHPSLQSNPFASESSSPDLATTTTADLIRKSSAEARKSQSLSIGTRTSGSSEAPRSAEKRRLFTFDSFKTPDSLHKRTSKSPLDSPLSKRYRAIEIPPMSARTSCSDENEGRRSGSGGLRKFSDLFRSRAGADAIPEDQKDLSPLVWNYNNDLHDRHARLENHLRRITYSPVYPHTDTSWYPRHPESLRSWRSRNLKCITCEESSCPCCHRTCCAYKAAVMASENHPKGSKCYIEAAERVQQITMLFPYGKEVSTFLQCNHNGIGKGPGCGKRVCPDCCGMCPDETCEDIQCKKCKPNFWAPCEWHATGTGEAASIISAATVARTV